MKFLRGALKSGLKAIGTRWVYTNKGDAANPHVGARLVPQETKRVSELTREDANSAFPATPPMESLKLMLIRRMTGDWRALADVKVLGLYDISGAHLHSTTRRTNVITSREDHGCCK